MVRVVRLSLDEGVLQEVSRQRVEILGVGVDKDVKAWEKALDAEKLPWLHVRDAKVQVESIW